MDLMAALQRVCDETGSEVAPGASERENNSVPLFIFSLSHLFSQFSLQMYKRAMHD